MGEASQITNRSMGIAASVSVGDASNCPNATALPSKPSSSQDRFEQSCAGRTLGPAIIAALLAVLQSRVGLPEKNSNRGAIAKLLSASLQSHAYTSNHLCGCIAPADVTHCYMAPF